MNRPAAMNAMSRGMITELRQTLEHAQHDPEAELIVLTGAGANFCAGDDLKEAERQTAEEFLALIMDLQRLTRLLMGEKPTIAAMDGYAVGGGFELALACDFRVATTRVYRPRLVPSPRRAAPDCWAAASTASTGSADSTTGVGGFVGFKV